MQNTVVLGTGGVGYIGKTSFLGYELKNIFGLTGFGPANLAQPEEITPEFHSAPVDKREFSFLYY